jgi:sulfonate transport system permease protein
MRENSNNRAYQIQSVIIAAIIPIFVLVYWKLAGDMGILNTKILASPHSVWNVFREMLSNGKYMKNVEASLVRVVKGYLAGAILGLLIGTLIGLYKNVNRALVAVIGILRPIPPIALIPFFILWLGIGETAKITVIAIGSFWPVLLNTMQGISEADVKLLELADVFGKNKLVIFFKIILPSAVPAIFTGLRLGISQAWTCVVTAEMIAASAGVGFMIQYARELAQPDLLLLGIITIGVIGVIIDVVMIFLQKKIVYWKSAEK